jgi:hypothetical protein
MLTGLETGFFFALQKHNFELYQKKGLKIVNLHPQIALSNHGPGQGL